MNKKFIMLYILCIIIMLVGICIIQFAPWLADEYHHKQQINNFIKGDYEIVPALTVIPGYHAIIAGVALLIGVQADDLFGLRTINAVLLTLGMIPLLWVLTKSIRRTLTIYLFPTLFSFYFLLYTDMMSVFFVLLAYYLFIKEKYTVSGIAALIAITIRQNNVVWLGMLMIIPLIELSKQINVKKWWYHKDIIIRGYAKKYWVYCVDCLIFMAFVIVNKGVVIYDRAYHPIAIHLMNIWFALFIGFFLFQPLIMYKYKEIWQQLKRPEGIAIMILLSSIIIITYNNTHWYNLLTNVGFVKNTVLIWGSTGIISKIIFAIPCVIMALWLSITQVNAQIRAVNMGYILAVFSTFVLLDWMVDMRYFMIPLMIFLLIRKEQDDKQEWIWFGYIVAIGIILFLGLMKHTIWW